MHKYTSILIGITLMLLTLGVVMLASTSGVLAEQRYGDPHFFVKRQVLWLVLGGMAGTALALFRYDHWKKLAVPFAVLSVLLLSLVIAPGVGADVKGSTRWLRYGSIGFQPSELAKFSTVVLLAWWMARFQRRAASFKIGMLAPSVFLGVTLALVFIEPDFGTTLLLAAVGGLVMFAGGTPFGYLLIAGAMGLTAFSLAVLQNPERLSRITAFANPEEHAGGAAYQLLNAIYAFVVGGAGGVGLGESMQKRFYLPEAHTDFIFAIIGEELGLGFSLGVVVLYLLFFLCGVRISFLAPDQFGRLLGFGITLMISMQAAINIGVVTGSLPTKGLALPFISFGGSSMVVSLAMVGVLVNIARYGVTDEEAEASRSIKDRARTL